MWKKYTHKGTCTLEYMTFPQHSKYEMLMLKQMGEGILYFNRSIHKLFLCQLTSGIDVVPMLQLCIL